MRRLLRVLAAFVGGCIASYVLVLVCAFAFWSVVPTPDPTKMVAATVFLIVGPALALVGGVWCAAWAARGRAPWPVTAFVRGRERQRAAMAAAAAVPVPAASAGERAIGWLFILLGGGGMALGAAGIAIFWGDGDPRLKIPVLYLLPVFLLAAVGWLGPAFLGGIGLLRGRVWGRPVVTVSAILLLLLVPVGTVAGVAALLVLHGHRLRRRDPPGREAVMARLHGAPAAGPATCEHLAPVELATAASGIRVTRLGERRAQAHCTAYPPSLRRLLPDDGPVVIEEWFAPERSPDDPPRLGLRCTACGSMLVFDAPEAQARPAKAGPWGR
ncbi:hypothetical protein [Alsobacter sp. R-9]